MRAEVDAYFAARGTVVVHTHIPATSPRAERDTSAADHAEALRLAREGRIRRTVLR